jgi:hypothetical protein
MKFLRFLLLFLFFSLTCYAETAELTGDSSLLNEIKSYENDSDNIILLEENNQIIDNNEDPLISDIKTFYALQEQYNILYKEASKDKELKIQEIKEQEQTSIDEIRNYPWLPDELDENGEPTSMALEYREKNIEAIKERFQIECNNVEDDFVVNNTEEMLSVKSKMDSIIDEISKKNYSYFDCNKNVLNYDTDKSRREYTNEDKIIDDCFFIHPIVNISDYPFLRVSSLPIGKNINVSFEAFPPESIEEFESTGVFPFYSEGIFSIQYDEVTNQFVIYLTKQIFYLSKDNSIIDTTKHKTKSISEFSSETLASQEDNKEVDNKDQTKHKEKKLNKNFNQDGRNGYYIAGGWGIGPYGFIWGFSNQIIFGYKNLYSGIYGSAQFHSIDSKFNSKYNDFSVVSLGALLGTTFTVWKFQPYVQVAAGGSIPVIEGRNADSTLVGFNANIETGIDIHFSKTVLGLYYRFDFFKERGATDIFCINLGFLF